MSEIVQKKGNIEIGGLSKTLPVGVRQLERIFAENIGMSPKQIAMLIRYQNLWHDMLFLPQFRILDAVCQYGYTDQPAGSFLPFGRLQITAVLFLFVIFQKTPAERNVRSSIPQNVPTIRLSAKGRFFLMEKQWSF